MMATPNTKSIKLEKNRPCCEHGREQHKASENIFSFLESSRFSPTKPTRLTPNDKIASERRESQLKTSQNGRFVNGRKNAERVSPCAYSDKMIPVPLILVSPHQAVQIKPEIESGLSAPQGLSVEENSLSQHSKENGSFAFDYELLPKLVEVHSSEPTLSLVRVQSNHYSHQINSVLEPLKKKGQDQKFSLGLPADEDLIHVSNPIYEQKCSPNQGLTTDDNNADTMANIRLAQPPSPKLNLVSSNFRSERTERDTVKEPEPVGDISMPTKIRKAYATAVTNNEQEKMDFVADRYASYEERDLPQANAITEEGEKLIRVVACQPVMSSGNFYTKRKSEDCKGQKICNDVNNNEVSSTVCRGNGHEEAAHRRLNPKYRSSGIKPGSTFHRSKTTQVEKLERELSFYQERAVTSSQVKQTLGRNGRFLDSPFNLNNPLSHNKYAYIMRNEQAVPQACSINDPPESTLDEKSNPEFSSEKALSSKMKLNTNFENCVEEKSPLARQRSNAKKADTT